MTEANPEDESSWRNVTEEDKRQAKESFKGFLVLAVALVVVVAALAMLGGADGETVVDTDNYQATTNTFTAEEGAQATVSVENGGNGYRTQVVVESPSGEVLLSEGVQDSATYELNLQESGEYTVRMEPGDSSPQTSGAVEVTLTS